MRQRGVQLDYGPAPTWGRRVLRRVLAVVLVITTAAVAWHSGPRAWRQAAMHYRQRQCLGYAGPAGRVVYEEDPAEAAKLIASGGGYSALPLLGQSGVTTDSASFVPTCWTALRAMVPLRYAPAP